MASNMKKYYHIKVSGKIQKYKEFIKEKADELNIYGWIRDCKNDNILIEAQGENKNLSLFICSLKCILEITKYTTILFKDSNEFSIR